MSDEVVPTKEKLLRADLRTTEAELFNLKALINTLSRLVDDAITAVQRAMTR